MASVLTGSVEHHLVVNEANQCVFLEEGDPNSIAVVAIYVFIGVGQGKAEKALSKSSRLRFYSLVTREFLQLLQNELTFRLALELLVLSTLFFPDELLRSRKIEVARFF